MPGLMQPCQGGPYNRAGVDTTVLGSVTVSVLGSMQSFRVPCNRAGVHTGFHANVREGIHDGFNATLPDSVQPC